MNLNKKAKLFYRTKSFAVRVSLELAVCPKQAIRQSFIDTMPMPGR